MTALTANGIKIQEGLLRREARDSFQELKRLFLSEPFLIHFDFSLLRFLRVDSSGYASLGILSQKDASGELQPVSCFSRKTNDAEKKWQVYDQELGAIIACFEARRAWWLGLQDPIIVYYDHANLRFFMKAQKLTER